MDILDILLDILLKPPQPLMGLFYKFKAQCVWCEMYGSFQQQKTSEGVDYSRKVKGKFTTV